MPKPLLLALALAALALGCPKAQPAGVTGTDQEQLDQLSAQLEELRTREQAQEPGCDDWCAMAKKVTDISGSMCSIAVRNRDNAEMQQKCVTSQEDIAHFSDRCATCKR